MKISELVGTYELGPSELRPDTLRIEIYLELGKRKKFFARIWRYEFFRIQPTFPQSDGKLVDDPSDEIVMVEEHEFSADPAHLSPSILALFEKIFSALGKRFEEERALEKTLRLLRDHLNEKAEKAPVSKSKEKTAKR